MGLDVVRCASETREMDPIVEARLGGSGTRMKGTL